MKISYETIIHCIDGCVVTDHDDLNIYDDADALYGGGWRSTDKEELKKEYGLSDSDAEKICEVMEKLEEEDHGKVQRFDE